MARLQLAFRVTPPYSVGQGSHVDHSTLKEERDLVTEWEVDQTM